MQPHPPLTADLRQARCEVFAGLHLSYARHLDAVTIETRDGLLLQTIRLAGFHFETADSDELNYRADLRDAMLRALSNSRFAVYHHVIRRRADVALEGDYQDRFSQTLHQCWRQRLGAKNLYVNELFLTIVRRPLPGRIGLAERVGNWLGKRSKTRNAALIAGEKYALDNACEALVAALRQYDPRVLTTYETEHGIRSEPLEFLGYLFNGEMRPMALPHGDLGHHIPARRISFGSDTVELAPAGPSPRRFAAVVSIKDYPGHTMPGPAVPHFAPA